ncbi:hypothetical protein BDY19DRAFT_906581 [Irpex rosettiformis]|uniref:Uncharacterized protein n=1 Tax=Irpex rosettiformis TaxID=378272 RepID=A0ACB8U2V4_9APHY|nr:hypothetical protein BDY19DRAFT_906581 [Irpex rosettiformis]
MPIGDKTYRLGTVNKASSFELLLYNAHFKAGSNFIDVANNYQMIHLTRSRLLADGSQQQEPLPGHQIPSTKVTQYTRRGEHQEYYLGNNVKDMRLSLEPLNRLRRGFLPPLLGSAHLRGRGDGRTAPIGVERESAIPYTLLGGNRDTQEK